MKNKSLIIKIAGLLFMICFAVFFLGYEWVANYNHGGLYSVYWTSDDKTEMVPLADGKTVTVPFVTDRELLCGFGISVGFDREPAGTLAYALKDGATGEVLAATETGVGSFDPDNVVRLDFDTLIAGCNGRSLIAELTFHPASDAPLNLRMMRNEEGLQVPVLYAMIGGKSSFVTAYTVIFLLLTLALLFVYCVAVFDKLRARFMPEHTFLVTILLVGFAFLLLIPTGVAPDDPMHLSRAYEISNHVLGKGEGPNGELLMRGDDAKKGFITVTTSKRAYTKYYDELFDGVEDETMVVTEEKISSAKGYLYVLPSIGITLGRLLHFGTSMMYLLGRLFNFALFVLVGFFAIRLLPFGKMVVFVWAMLPMTLQQATSFSYDSPINSLCVMVTALTLHLLYGKDVKKKPVKLALLIICALLLLPCKDGAIAPLALLPMLLVFGWWKEHGKDIREKVRAKIPFAKWILLAVAALVIFAILLVSVKVTRQLTRPENINNYDLYWTDESGYTIGYFILHPTKLVGILVGTLWTKGDGYLAQMLGGQLGWLNITVPMVIILPFFLLMIFAAVRRTDEGQCLSGGAKAWMLLMSFLVCGFSFAGMLTHWTPATYPYIEGVQGRYFLPFLVPVFLTIRSKRTSVDGEMDRIIPVLTVMLEFFVVMSYSFCIA